MKFSQIEYKRPDFEELFVRLDDIIAELTLAKSAKEQLVAFDSFCDVTKEYNTQHAVARIRNFLDTNDEFYKKEHEIISKNNPILSSKYQLLRYAINKSYYKEELYELIGYTTRLNHELATKSFSKEIVDDIRLESKLVLEYIDIISKLSVKFDGKVMPLNLLVPYKEHPDREVRKKAFVAEGECYNTVKQSLDDIFDRLVKCRDTQAKKLGFDNYIELGYAHMRRNCYNSSDVKVFRQQVLEDLVPLVEKIKKSRCKRLGLKEIKLYDLQLSFKEGSPKPQITADEIIKAAVKMYSEMSDQTAEFIRLMVDNELYDIYPKVGKAPGGFCSYIANYNYPFIFANFNKTSSDVNVFTHESGHAFARFLNRDKISQNYTNNTMDISETHSMAMEFLATPWYPLFFKGETKKYELAHAEDALMLISYSCQVDEFQEQIYQNPGLTPKQRDEKWLEIESRYRPNIYADDIPFYSNGAGWQRQTHIYKTPFYYIDYGIAQVMALQFFEKHIEDSDAALKKYMDFVGYGNSKTFVDLVKAVGLTSPLNAGTVKPIVDSIYEWMSALRL